MAQMVDEGKSFVGPLMGKRETGMGKKNPFRQLIFKNSRRDVDSSGRTIKETIMNLSSISGSNQSAANGANKVSPQTRAELHSLFSSLESGDASAAKSALATIQQDQPNLFSNPNSPLSSLAQEIQSGNITAAQKDLAQLRQEAAQARHNQSGNAGSTTSSSNGSVGSVLNVSV